MSIKINYISKGSGIPLVFQHGLTANVAQIDNLLGGLADLQLVSIDCPGHGETKLPKDYRPSFDKFADEVIEFLNRKGIHKAIFGGLSMGSGIALNIAIRYPERVLAIIILRPAWLDCSNPENLHLLLPGADLIGKKDGLTQFQNLPEYKKLASIVPNAAASAAGVFNPDQQPELPIVIRHMVDDHPFEKMSDLEKIKVSCLTLGNDDDPFHPFTMAVKLHNNIKGSKLVKLTSRYIDNDAHRTEVRENISTFVQQLRKDI